MLLTHAQPSVAPIEAPSSASPVLRQIIQLVAQYGFRVSTTCNKLMNDGKGGYKTVEAPSYGLDRINGETTHESLVLTHEPDLNSQHNFRLNVGQTVLHGASKENEEKRRNRELQPDETRWGFLLLSPDTGFSTHQFWFEGQEIVAAIRTAIESIISLEYNKLAAQAIAANPNVVESINPENSKGILLLLEWILEQVDVDPVKLRNVLEQRLCYRLHPQVQEQFSTATDMQIPATQVAPNEQTVNKEEPAAA